jgi:Nucleotidyltransferase domain
MQAQLTPLGDRLVEVPGVAGVMLGGSRARDDFAADSDYDLGVYYRPPLDVEALGRLAIDVAGPDARVTQPGAWGPWVDGGGWLTIDGFAVDWIYRDLDRVQASWRDAQAGRYAFHWQVGHPLGVPDFAYAGEVALGVVLADPTGELTELQRSSRDYPNSLRRALIDGLGEAEFLLMVARKAVPRRDTAYVVGCLFRIVGLGAHALHGHAGRWLINEKGAVDAASRLPNAPGDFARRAHELLGSTGGTAESLTAALDAAEGLIADVSRSCGREPDIQASRPG